MTRGEMILAEFEAFLRDPSERSFVYHCGELGRDKRDDPDLQAIADRVLEVGDVRFDKVSKCGHVRGEHVGLGLVKLVTRRSPGGVCYIAVKAGARGMI